MKLIAGKCTRTSPFSTFTAVSFMQSFVPEMTASQSAPLLTIWTAYSPRTIFPKAAQFTFFLLLLTGIAKASAGVEASCLMFQKRCVGRKGPLEP